MSAQKGEEGLNNLLMYGSCNFLKAHFILVSCRAMNEFILGFIGLIVTFF